MSRCGGRQQFAFGSRRAVSGVVGAGVSVLALPIPEKSKWILGRLALERRSADRLLLVSGQLAILDFLPVHVSGGISRFLGRSPNG
jgi:hypothetical protein